MEALRQWILTLSFLLIAVAAMATVLQPRESHATPAPATHQECVFLELFVNKWMAPYRVPMRAFVEETSEVKAFSLKGWTPVTSSGAGVLMCR